MADLVAQRQQAGDKHLYYIDGLALFGEQDAADLPDLLHPNSAGYRRMGERFARLVFNGQYI
jgi:lysophospholipase L1-like esterase